MTGTLAPTFIWFREGLEAYLIVQMAWLMVTNYRQKSPQREGVLYLCLNNFILI